MDIYKTVFVLSTSQAYARTHPCIHIDTHTHIIIATGDIKRVCILPKTLQNYRVSSSMRIIRLMGSGHTLVCHGYQRTQICHFRSIFNY